MFLPLKQMTVAVLVYIVCMVVKLVYLFSSMCCIIYHIFEIAQNIFLVAANHFFCSTALLLDDWFLMYCRC